MALFVRQENSRTELQERLATELQEKLKQERSSIEYEKPVNSIEHDTSESRNLGAIVVMITAVVILGIAYLLLSR